MKSSSAAQRLKLKQEQGDDCSKMQGSRGLMSSLELRLGISSDNGAGCGGGGDPLECTPGALPPGKQRR
jgi:auxin-responsive protein IAA